MESLLGLMYLFLFLPVLFLPVLCLVWVLLVKHTGRAVRNPFSLMDAFMPVICVLIWGGVDVCFASVHKRMGNLIEIVVLGGVWTLMFLIRLYMLYRHPNVSKWRLVCWSTWGIIFLSVIFAFFIPSAIE